MFLLTYLIIPRDHSGFGRVPWSLPESTAIADAIYFNGSVKESNKFHNYETEKITRKASDAAEYIELFGSSTTRDRHAWRN